MQQIFISHSSRDADAAKEICELLEKNGARCFIAPRDIRSGKEYAEEIVNGIDTSVAVVLLMSENANKSPHVLREVERAVSKSIPILVYKLEEVILSKSMEYFLMAHQWVGTGRDHDYSDILAYVKELEEREAFVKPSVKCADHNGSDSDNPNQAQRMKKKRLGRILIPAVCMAVVLALGLFMFFHGKNREMAIAKVNVGDTVSFGSYNGEDIAWRVLRLSEDGTQAVLVSANVLTMKAFDAAESGKFNWYGDEEYWTRSEEVAADMELQVILRGNSDWSVSNIRTWLNADGEVVTYTDQPPMATAMAELKNGYHNEAGFLNAFTTEELSAIVETENVTKTNGLSEADTITTMDRVYLLSLDELQWFEEAGISTLAIPTEAAIAQDTSNWYILDLNEFGVKESCWWLRDAVPDAGSKCYMVGNGYSQDNIIERDAGLEGFGIRPALTVDLRKVTFREQEVTK